MTNQFEAQEVDVAPDDRPTEAMETNDAGRKCEYDFPFSPSVPSIAAPQMCTKIAFAIA